MTQSQVLLRYMRAVIRGRDGRCVNALREEDLLEAFNTLPEPEISVEDWARLSNIDMAAIAAQEEAKKQEISNQVNATILSAVQQAGAPIKVE